MRQKRCFRLTLHGQKYVDIRNKPESTAPSIKTEDGEKNSLTQCFLDGLHLGLFLIRSSAERGNLYVCV